MKMPPPPNHRVGYDADVIGLRGRTFKTVLQVLQYFFRSNALWTSFSTSGIEIYALKFKNSVHLRIDKIE